DERRQLGEVADRVVRLAEEPRGKPRLLDRGVEEDARRDVPLESAAGEEEERPRRILGRRAREIGLERRELAIRLGRRVERVEGRREPPHGPPPFVLSEQGRAAALRVEGQLREGALRLGPRFARPSLRANGVFIRGPPPRRRGATGLRARRGRATRRG